MQRIASLLLEEVTSDGFKFIPTTDLSSEEIQAIADVAGENDYDIDVRDEQGQELLVFVPRALSDDPLNHMDVEADFNKDYEKNLKKFDGS